SALSLIYTLSLHDALPISSRDFHPGSRNVGEAVGVVGCLIDCVGEILADLVPIHVDRGDKVDVTDVIAAEVDVHDSGHAVAGLRSEEHTSELQSRENLVCR